jgi:chromate reductase, NAD(P)H dehydrogenase (quinone)
VRQQQRPAAHACRRQGSLGARMAAADHDHVEFFWVEHWDFAPRAAGPQPPENFRFYWGVHFSAGMRPLWEPCAKSRAACVAIGAMKLLVFAGSTRQNSWNRKLAKVTAAMASASGAEVTHLELGDFDVPMYNADLEARGTPADVMKLKQIAYDHPAWIICTPEYNASYPALLKNTLDWMSSPVKSDPVWNDDFRFSRGKVVGVLSASPGALGGLRSQSHLVPLLLNLQCWVAPKNYALGRAADAFDAQGQLVADAAKKKVQGVIDQVLWAAQRLSMPG